MKSKHDTSAFASHLSLKVAMVSLFVIFLNMQVFAQGTTTTQTIRGTVKSTDDNQPVPGTNIYLKSQSSVGTFSDVNGEFVFPGSLKNGDVIVFSFMGLKTTEYVVTDQPAGSIIIAMVPEPIQFVDEIVVEGDESASTVAPAKRFRKIRAQR